jgi:hypothetical protein
VILGKFWRAFKAQPIKLANLFWTADPIAQMQYEYDTAVEQVKQGREGLEQYRALVGRAGRQTATLQGRAAHLSGEGVEQIRQEQDVQKARAELALRRFEVEMGLRTPETTNAPPKTKELRPARRNTTQG